MVQLPNDVKGKCRRNALTASMGNVTVVNTDVGIVEPLIRLIQAHNDAPKVSGRESRGIGDQVSANKSDHKLETGDIEVSIFTQRLFNMAVNKCFI